MLRYLPILLSVGILGAAAMAHGWRTERWGASPDMQAAVNRLDRLPAQIDDWNSEPVAMGELELAVAGVAGHLSRQYQHRYTGDTCSVLALCGRPGNLAVHTPEICYTNAGYMMSGKEVLDLGDGNSAWTATFTKPGLNPDRLQVTWTWGVGPRWIASDSPRTAFAREPYLYKIYYVRRLGSSKGPRPADEEAARFTKKVFAEMRTAFTPQ